MNEKYGTPSKRGIGSRTEDKLEYLQRAIEFAERNNVDIVVLAGDIFDKVNPPEKLRVAFLDLLAPLIEKNIHTYIIIGNHDTDTIYHNLAGESSFIRRLGEITKPPYGIPITIVDTHVLIKNFLGLDLLFVAWDKDESIKETLKRYNPAHFVFGHFQAVGATASGTEFHLSGGIEKDAFNKYIYTFLGHIHKFQYTDSWVHVGSIAKMDMGEAQDPKGFIHFKVTHEQFSWDFIEIPDRKFVNLSFTEPAEVDISTGLDVKDAVVKVTCEGSDAWFIHWDITSIPSKLYEAGAYRVVHQFVHINDKVSSTSDFVSQRNYTKMIEDYAETMKRKDLTLLGIEILNQGAICD